VDRRSGYIHLPAANGRSLVPVVGREIDDTQQFQPMTEDEMVTESLAAWAEYQHQPEGVLHDVVKRWAESLGRADELPCPQ
jgi:hypothetical protein